MSFHFKGSELKWKYLCHKRITLERKLSKEALTFEEVVQLMKDVIVKNNENIMIFHIYVDDMLDKMVEHFVQQMQSEIELSMVMNVARNKRKGGLN